MYWLFIPLIILIPPNPGSDKNQLQLEKLLVRAIHIHQFQTICMRNTNNGERYLRVSAVNVLAVHPINLNNPPKPVRRSETAADPGSDKNQLQLEKLLVRAELFFNVNEPVSATPTTARAVGCSPLYLVERGPTAKQAGGELSCWRAQNYSSMSMNR
jgi:hypothetical protein